MSSHQGAQVGILGVVSQRSDNDKIYIIIYIELSIE